MVMSVILFVPSWGGMINGIMTLSGAWHKLKTDPILRFLIVSLSFYGMSTFEGPMMAIKSVNALSHYTDWTVGHVHSGALGWVAMVSIGALVPPNPSGIWPRPDVQRQTGQYPLLVTYYRRGALHRSYVDQRHYARHDVACCQH